MLIFNICLIDAMSVVGAAVENMRILVEKNLSWVGLDYDNTYIRKGTTSQFILGIVERERKLYFRRNTSTHFLSLASATSTMAAKKNRGGDRVRLHCVSVYDSSLKSILLPSQSEVCD